MRRWIVTVLILVLPFVCCQDDPDYVDEQSDETNGLDGVDANATALLCQNLNPPRQPQYIGVWRFDASATSGSPEAANNACFYHFCVANQPQYADNGGDRLMNLENRVQSGQATYPSLTGCRKFPLSQRYWDPVGLNIELDLDEFPMAAMLQNNLVPGTIRNSLRCIDLSDNRRAGAYYGQFRRGIGKWAQGGALAGDRNVQGALCQGDTFDLQFVNVNPTLSPYCARNTNPPSAGCVNDGFEYYLTNLRRRSPTGPGILDFVYDPSSMNTYRMQGANNDLDEYQYVVTRSGANGENVVVQVADQAGTREIGRTEVEDITGDTSILVTVGVNINPPPARTETLAVVIGPGYRTQISYSLNPRQVAEGHLNQISWTSASTGHSRQAGFTPAGAYCEMVADCDGNGNPVKEITNCWMSSYLS